jgi:hypothetical protein
MALWDKGIILNPSPPPPAMLYGVILCSIVFLQAQSDETIFCHLSWCSDKVTAFKNILFQQLWRNVFLMKFILHQQAINLAKTNLPVTQTLHHFLNCVVPYSDLCPPPPQIMYWYSLMMQLIFPFFTLAEAVHGRLWGWSEMPVFPSLKCFTYSLTLLVPKQVSLYAYWSHAWISDVGISYLTWNSIIAHSRNMSLPAIFLQWNMAIRWAGCGILWVSSSKNHDTTYIYIYLLMSKSFVQLWQFIVAEKRCNICRSSLREAGAQHSSCAACWLASGRCTLRLRGCGPGRLPFGAESDSAQWWSWQDLRSAVECCSFAAVPGWMTGPRCAARGIRITDVTRPSLLSDCHRPILLLASRTNISFCRTHDKILLSKSRRQCSITVAGPAVVACSGSSSDALLLCSAQSLALVVFDEMLIEGCCLARFSLLIFGPQGVWQLCYWSK